jgi:xylulose-5-phosphate/fructose-6-phosphate phosphoketolase
MNKPLSPVDLSNIDGYWRASNYISVGQIYLLDNPLLREPLKREHIKPRLLGHWGTSPGLNLIYVHLNRVIKAQDLNVLFITGPGHGGPSLVAHAYLEGTYTEVYPNVSEDEVGLKTLFTQFSFPGGIPSHVAPETPGSIHEGGELGYALSHAFGAAFDNPNLIVAAVVGDGEAETGPLATSWHSNKFLNPVTDGAVLPILHLNGYKIASPTILARIPKDELQKLFEGYGYKPYFVEGHEPAQVHQDLAAVMDTVTADIQRIWTDARTKRITGRPVWPMIILRTPKGWTCPAEIDGKKCEDYWRSHQVPMGDMDKAGHIEILEKWMKSYQPEELFNAEGKFNPGIAALAPRGARRMSANPHANGGSLLENLQMPDYRKYAVNVASPGAVDAESTRVMGKFLCAVVQLNLPTKNLRQHLPDVKVRVVNVVNLMKLQSQREHPHGLSDDDFDAIFTTDRQVLFAFHGYPSLIHQLTYRRTNHRNLHVRGYKEEGTTTTPFDMVVMNDMDRFRLVIDVIDRVPGLADRASEFRRAMVDKRAEHKRYIAVHGEDMPEITDWRWRVEPTANESGSPS